VEGILVRLALHAACRTKRLRHGMGMITLCHSDVGMCGSARRKRTHINQSDQLSSLEVRNTSTNLIN
jgi:hypothetical protein